MKHYLKIGTHDFYGFEDNYEVDLNIFQEVAIEDIEPMRESWLTDAERYQIKAQEEQSWVQQELAYCDMQRKYSFDTKRFDFDSIEQLNQYVIALRDYVTRNKETNELTVHGERPVRP